ncbi:MAG: hypothetical protein HYW47_05110 [Deltaproteobacteria bacterium]|nr:hypothetical protein [Deltaproteobacteria bacterium]
MRIKITRFFVGGFFLLSLWTMPQVRAENNVTLANVLTKLKIKGRAAMGYLRGGRMSSFPSGSFDIPDAKIIFNFFPDNNIDLTARFNLNNAGGSAASGATNAPLVDYLYIQGKDFIPSLKGTPWSLNGRLGRAKIGVGEETWSDNPIEGPLPSNSAAALGGSDELVELSGKFWAVSIGNGSRGVVTDTSVAKAVYARLFYTPLDSLYISGYYYNSGQLGITSSEASIAGLVAVPAGATNWKRQVWGGDIRYDFKKGKKFVKPLFFSDSKAAFRVSLAQFKDSVRGAANRNGTFGHIDGIYNFTSSFFVAARLSGIQLAGSQTQSINTVTTHYYGRASLGGGYRWSDNVCVKLSYDYNKNGGAGTNDANDDLVSVLLTMAL